MLDTAKWFAVHARSRHEKSVHAQLQGRALESFLPTYRSLRQWKDRCVEVEFPLFPGYLFVHITPQQQLTVERTPGVVQVVKSASRPIPIEAIQIDAIRRGLPTGRIEPHEYVEAGERVVIAKGPFVGVEGTLKCRKNTISVIVTIAAIMQSIAIEVRINDIRPLGRSLLVTSRGSQERLQYPNTRSA